MGWPNNAEGSTL